jgi:hypothetical protein
MSCTMWSSIHRNEAHATTVAVKVYTPEDLLMTSVDDLRLVHQALMSAAADVLDSMASIASENIGLK